MVHGIVGFDEIRLIGTRHDYFRGIVAALAARGVTTYRPRLPWAASVPERARRLAEFIRGLPGEKVNVIAHSMGGLDARYAIAHLGLADKIECLVTVATPHRGTPLAALGALRATRALRQVVQRLGLDTSGVEWLTPAGARRFNDDCPDQPGVRYACVVASARTPWHSPWLFPSWLYLRATGGHSDGMVPRDSQHWGETLFEVDVDHFTQIGWSFAGGPADLYARIVEELARRGH
jgi:triacylglycerol lipase